MIRQVTAPGRPLRPPQRRPPPRRPPPRRPVPARVRRRRTAAVLLVVLGATGLILATWNTSGARQRGHPQAGRRTGPARPLAARGPLPAVESGLMPWHLSSPVSREVVVAAGGNRLMILGGLTAGGASVNGIFAVHPVAGQVRHAGALRAPLHDAAAVMLGRHALVFGGGSPVTVPAVEQVTPAGRHAAATIAGRLPAPRSDAVAVRIGSTGYLVGGYDGAHPAASVLATSDGRTFRQVATLPVPVRYPAAAPLGARIFVFGGQAVTGRRAGRPVTTIQVIDPARHTAAVAGHLPEPLAGAAAVTIGQHVYVAGGESTVPQRHTPGVGTTQYPLAHAAAPAAPRTFTVSTIWAFDPAARRLLVAGRLQVPVSHAGVAVTGNTAWLVGGESGGALTGAVQMMRPDRAFGTAGVPGAGSPYFGAKLLIADRGNNRLLLMTDTMHVVWRYPSRTTPKDPFGFYFPDDAFFTGHGTAILSNQEQNETIIKIGFPSGKIMWHYGHPHQAGTAPGYLHEPDDAYLLKNGQIAVADANNCRVLVLNPGGGVAHQIGTNGVCRHHPPASMGTPNGDTPLANGNLLISEINGSWVSEYTPAGKLVWTVHLPISYPSDPQQLGPDRYLIADYATPGQILEFNRQGRILYRYRAPSGPGALDHPSLTELLPSGAFMVNDDYNHRMAAFDPVTKALVWQYGITGRPGTRPGMLHTPDGFDLLLPNGSTPTHKYTG
jgi:hypothetical protein